MVAGALAAAGDVQGIVTSLAQAGADHFLVPNLPDLGATPRARITDAVLPGFAQLATLFSTTFNQALAGALPLFTGIDVTLFDTFALLSQAVQNPGAFGLTNVTDPCFVPSDPTRPYTSPGTVCANPNEYLFWDQLHPTARTHGILAGAMYVALVPEPPVAAILVLAVFLALRVRRPAL